MEGRKFDAWGIPTTYGEGGWENIHGCSAVQIFIRDLKSMEVTNRSVDSIYYSQLHMCTIELSFWEAIIILNWAQSCSKK